MTLHLTYSFGDTTLSSGNTSLRPAVSDALRASCHDGQWVLSLQLSHLDRKIVSWQPEVTPGPNTLLYRSHNLRYLRIIGLTNTHTVSPATWWELQTHLTLQYQVARTGHLLRNTTYALYSNQLNAIHTIRLPKCISIGVSGVYQSTSRSGLAKFLPAGSLNAGLQKAFGKAGTIRLAVDDLLCTNNWRIKTYSPENNLVSRFLYDWHNRFSRLTYTRQVGHGAWQLPGWKSGSAEERGSQLNRFPPPAPQVDRQVGGLHERTPSREYNRRVTSSVSNG